MKHTIQLARQQNNLPLANPTSLTELELYEQFTQKTNGQPFLLHDSGPSNDRILLFSTQRNLDLIMRCNH